VSGSVHSSLFLSTRRLLRCFIVFSGLFILQSWLALQLGVESHLTVPVEVVRIMSLMDFILGGHLLS